MAQPWKIIESIATDEGTLELRQRGERDFLIMIGTQVLMNSLANRSEVVLGKLGCGNLRESVAPRVLIGGLGMGAPIHAKEKAQCKNETHRSGPRLQREG